MNKIITLVIAILIFLACKEDAEKRKNVIDATSSILEKKVDSTILLSEKIIKKKTSKSIQQVKAKLKAEGFKAYDYVDEITKDTILIQKYFMAFIKKGPIRVQNEEELEAIEKAHIEHLKTMHKLGYADISGMFNDRHNNTGITIYNVPTLKIADSLARLDPMVQAGYLDIEVRPWWSEKGASLR